MTATETDSEDVLVLDGVGNEMGSIGMDGSFSPSTCICPCVDVCVCSCVCIDSCGCCVVADVSIMTINMSSMTMMITSNVMMEMRC